MPDSKSAKGNPASHRMGNPKRKLRGAASAARRQKRRAAAAEKVRATEGRNAQIRRTAARVREGFMPSAGEQVTLLTPWEAACAARRERREKAGLAQKHHEAQKATHGRNQGSRRGRKARGGRTAAAA